MEHPFLVEEFTPAHTTHASANRLATAETQSSTALPPLPNLSASEVLFLTPSDPQYGSYRSVASLDSRCRGRQQLLETKIVQPIRTAP